MAHHLTGHLEYPPIYYSYDKYSRVYFPRKFNNQLLFHILFLQCGLVISPSKIGVCFSISFSQGKRGMNVLPLEYIRNVAGLLVSICHFLSYGTLTLDIVSLRNNLPCCAKRNPSPCGKFIYRNSVLQLQLSSQQTARQVNGSPALSGPKQGISSKNHSPKCSQITAPQKYFVISH